MSSGFCYLCEIYKEAADPELAGRIKMLVSGLPQKERAQDSLYAKRLDTCALCEKLLDNTCRSCGCYIELRAAKKDSHCPDKKW